MGTRWKEKMMKWSRKVGTLEKVTKGLAVVALALLGLYILSIFGIQLIPGIVWKPIVIDILAFIWAVTLLLPLPIVNVICFILMIAFPWKIAECFEAKLKK